MSTLNFKTKLYKIGSWTILALPKSTSEKLPSRGITMVEGTLNGHEFQSPLEPDGKGSHWFRVSESMLKTIKAEAGDAVILKIEPSEEWPEPTIPPDLKKALEANPHALNTWMETTPIARWDWIRWINGTKEQSTRKRRIEVACSKLKSGMKRPCCFNRSMCTEPTVSNNGVLLAP